MSSSDKSLLEFITRLAYNIEGLPGELKLYFSQFLTFHFLKRLSRNQIQDIENKRASSVYSSPEEIAKAASSFTQSEKEWAVAAIQILQSQAEKIDDRIVSRRINKLLTELISTLKLEGEMASITEQRKRIEDEIHQFQNRQVVKIPANIWPLTVDYLLRWTLLLGFSYLGIEKGFLAGLNIFFIPIFILIIVYFVGRRHQKSNRQLISAYGGEQSFKIEYQVSTSQYTWLAIYLGTSVFISYLLPDQLHVLALFGLIFYYFIYLRFFRVGKLKENDLVKQLEKENLNTESLTVDENDEVIVALETKLNSSTSRLEAYVLESALFGALSFSGFLQIMATDLVSFTDLENFANYIFSTSQAFIHFNWTQFNAGLAGLSNKTSLFCLVSVESLICSIFFLAVIASRLRFSDIADRVRTAINMAKAYNEKEESLHEEQEITGKKIIRLDTLTAKVNEQLHEANLVLVEISPVMTYMEYFRNAGILVFVIILISSSLFITGALGWIFVALVLATYLYFNRTSINNKFKAAFLNFRIQFIKQGFWLFGLAFLPMILGYVLRIFFHVQQTDFLFPLSSVLIGLYIFTWLVIAAHVDEQFGEIEMDKVRQRRWIFVKNTIAISILLYQVAYSFKNLHLMGANEMLMISLVLLAIMMVLAGYYLTKVRSLGLVCGVLIGLGSLGIMLKYLHLAGGKELVQLSAIGSSLFIPVIYLKRNLFHRLLLKFFVGWIFVILLFFNFFSDLPRRLHVAYIHATTDIKEILLTVSKNYSESTLLEGPTAVNDGIAQADWYMSKYGKQFGFNLIYRDVMDHYMNYVSESVSSPVLDSVRISSALKVAREGAKILNMFTFDEIPDGYFFDEESPFLMESKVLNAMGKKEEAVQSLQKILKRNPQESLKEILSKKISEINSH